MPLILAIEPDRRQASQLTAIVRGRLHAELVLGESAERALAALGQRVPDLILTSALLSPKDENALGERLRTLDGAAAHVQTLTIPVLASSSGRGSNRASGVLSALRREKNQAAASPDGCDPGVFAEQCKEYLERAASERAALAERAAVAAQDEQDDFAAAPPPVTRPASSRESKKAKAEERHEPAALVEPPAAEAPVDPIIETFRDVEEPVAAAPVEPSAPAGKRKGQKSGKKKPLAGIRTVLGLPQDDNDGPASLLAAVAALEAEEQTRVEPMVAEVPRQTPIVEPIANPAFAETPRVDAASEEPSDEPRYTSPITERYVMPSAIEPRFDPPPSAEPRYTSSLPGSRYDASVGDVPLVKPAADVPLVKPRTEAAPTFSSQFTEDLRRASIGAEQPAGEDILDLSSLLDASSTSAPPRPASTFNEEPAVEVYELDNSLLSTSFEDAVRPLTTEADPFATSSPAAQPPRAEGRSWPVLDTLIAETAAFQAAAPAVAPAAAQPAPAPRAAEEAPLGDILEALRRDAEPRAIPMAPPAPSDEPAEVRAEAEGDGEPEASGADQAGGDSAAKKKKRAKASPAQDEWGFFDPDQCGFAALIEKLEEITDKDDTPTPRRA